MRKLLLIAILLLVLPYAAAAAQNQVLVVENTQSKVSEDIGNYYAAKRHIPARYICHISVAPMQKVTLENFRSKIRKPIMDYIAKHSLSSVNYIVTTKGVPLYDNRGFSVDSMLVAAPIEAESKLANPYFAKQARFSHVLYGIYLVTRLDAYTQTEAKALVDRSLKAHGKRGKFLLDVDPTEDNRPGYMALNQDMRAAASSLLDRGFPVILDQTNTFVGGKTGLMGYYSWGSNDNHFSKKNYLSNRFVPGAIAETIVSTSARTFEPTTGGQSLIADLIRTGITGVKGYVSEPYGTAMAVPSILFDRYTKGYNLAESFYMASPFISWKDVVIGDPLCAPYALKGP